MIWKEETLFDYLLNPKKYIPGGCCTARALAGAAAALLPCCLPPTPPPPAASPTRAPPKHTHARRAGTKMVFAGLKKPEERANLIAYLKASGCVCARACVCVWRGVGRGRAPATRVCARLCSRT